MYVEFVSSVVGELKNQDFPPGLSSEPKNVPGLKLITKNHGLNIILDRPDKYNALTLEVFYKA